LLAGLGLLSAVGGLVLFVAPELATSLTTDDVVIALLGTVALSQAAFAAVRYDPRRRLAVPTPEVRDGVRRPGASFDLDLRRLDPDVRERLRTTAVDVVSKFGRATPEEARRRLDKGTWTDDGRAAEFFSPDRSSPRLRRPVWLGGEPLVVEQAIAAIESLSEHVDEYLPNGFEGDVDYSGGGAGSDFESASREAADTSSPGEEPDGREPPSRLQTGRWRGVEAVALLTIALGAVLSSSSILLMGGIGVALVGYAAYGRAGTAGGVELAIERSVEPGAPTPGEEVTVTVTVCNEGSRLLPDLRIFDGVPPDLAVTGGTARHAATLRPDRQTAFSYTLEAEYGDHRFDPATVHVGDVSGERRRVVEAGGDDTRLECRVRPSPAREAPLRKFVSKYAGQVTADEGGSGVQFHETREYQRGDPISLINWKSLARTGELTALEFTEERIVEVMAVVDARPESSLASNSTERSAVARSAEAVDRLAATLLAENNRVGVAIASSKRLAVGLGSGSEHGLAVRQVLADYPSAVRAASSASTSTLNPASVRRHLSGRTQVVLFSPLCDDAPVGFARRLEASGTPTTVVSPNPMTTKTPGGMLASVERLVRIETLREAGIPVIEWFEDESLSVALERGRRTRQRR
jgi:uncharacterized protein (DUF58 family)